MLHTRMCPCCRVDRDDEEEEKEDEKKENPGIETDSKPNASHQAAPEPPGDCNGSKETTDDDPMDQEVSLH